MSTVAAVRARAVAVPARYWLAGIVVVSIVVRVALARRIVAPWIMIDELVYSELAKSFAAHGHFLVRGVPSHGYGFVYPILIAPAWRLFGSMPAVYTAAKAINGVLMSLAAIPAYFLARRVLPARLSLIVAALAVLVPSMLYTGMLMTENAFYPIFLTFALLLVVTLERPTPLRQAGLLALCLVAFETRAQAVALIPAIATAPVLLALIERRGLRRGLRPFATLYGLLAGGVALAVLVTVARGRSPLSLLGAYRAATSSTYTVSGVLHFFLYHVAELDLYLGIVPFAALLAIWLAPRRSTPPARAFAAASFALTIWLVAEVAAFASESFVNRIEERNMFYLAPLALIALLGLGLGGGRHARPPPAPDRGRGRPGCCRSSSRSARFITTSAVSDTFALLPWWWAQDTLIHLSQVRWAALGVSLAAAAVFLLLPRRYALVLAALVGAYFVATALVVENGRHGIHHTTVGSLWAGIHQAHPDWIDRTARARNARSSVLWDGSTSAYTVWENEFFNRSVGTVYDVDGAQRPDPLPETPVSRAANGTLVSQGGRPIRAQYVLARRVARDRREAARRRRRGRRPLPRQRAGRRPHPRDRALPERHLVGPLGHLRARRVHRRHRSRSSSRRDRALFTRAQTVVAREAGRVVGRASIAPTAQRVLKVPLIPAANGRCTVRFTVGQTLVPDRVERGSADRRPLGAHFLFAYHP